MDFALYLNGVYEKVLEDIVKAQTSNPGMVCYLQPYAPKKIAKLAQSAPSKQSPVTLYVSLTSSLPLISYRAEIVGWENKQDLSKARLARLKDHIRKYQPREKEIYMRSATGKPAVNLISVVNMERLASPIPVSTLVKVSDDRPLKPRTRAGLWSFVHPILNLNEVMLETVLEEQLTKELEEGVKKSYKRTEAQRTKRLKKASKLPKRIRIVSQGFRRNPDVIASVMHRAKGVCEYCGNAAPFSRASDGSPYLEVHHKTMLSKGGEDTVKNAIAVCPNCHRKLHFGS